VTARTLTTVEVPGEVSGTINPDIDVMLCEPDSDERISLRVTIGGHLTANGLGSEGEARAKFYDRERKLVCTAEAPYT